MVRCGCQKSVYVAEAQNTIRAVPQELLPIRGEDKAAVKTHWERTTAPKGSAAPTTIYSIASNDVCDRHESSCTGDNVEVRG